MNRLLEDLAAAVTAVVKNPPSDDELADFLGEMREAEKRLAAYRLKWEKVVHELPPEVLAPAPSAPEPTEPASTPEWRLEPQTRNVYSFCTPALAVAVAKVTDWDTFKVLLEAQRAGAVQWKWGYEKTVAWLESLNVPLHMTYNEIDDDGDSDGPMIGRVKVPAGVKKVRVEPEEPVEVVPDMEPEDET